MPDPSEIRAELLRKEDDKAKEQACGEVECRLCGETGVIYYALPLSGERYRYPNWATQEEDRRRAIAVNAWLDEHREACVVMGHLENLSRNLENISTKSG